VVDVTERRQELADNVRRVRDRIAAACASSGREPAAVTLVAVTKTWPASDAALMRDLGIPDLGENRDQEARQKAGEVDGVRWHFIGSVQTNKARSVAGYADVVHSVDRPELAAALGRGAVQAGRVVEALVQVSLDGDPARGGAPAAAVPQLVDVVAGCEGLVLRGVTAIAPRGADPLSAFWQLQAIAAQVVVQHPSATVISAGMSGDLEAAIEAGATHVRVGTALFGPRTGMLR
jgi:PLP dependent protein